MRSEIGVKSHLGDQSQLFIFSKLTYLLTYFLTCYIVTVTTKEDWCNLDYKFSEVVYDFGANASWVKKVPLTANCILKHGNLRGVIVTCGWIESVPIVRERISTL